MPDTQRLCDAGGVDTRQRNAGARGRAQRHRDAVAIAVLALRDGASCAETVTIVEEYEQELDRDCR